LQGYKEAVDAGKLKGHTLAFAKKVAANEARHAGAVAELLGKSISPSGAYDAGKSMKDILAAVKATKFIKA
jgi:hypothetical protein